MAFENLGFQPPHRRSAGGSCIALLMLRNADRERFAMRLFAPSGGLLKKRPGCGRNLAGQPTLLAATYFHNGAAWASAQQVELGRDLSALRLGLEREVCAGSGSFLSRCQYYWEPAPA